ncbi:MAG: O-antigen ligase family protein [Gammaproteobacteria bacterium]
MRAVAFRASLLFILLLPFENSVFIPVLGSLAKVAGLFLAASWLLTVITEGRVRKPHLIHLIMLLFVLWVGLSVFWSIDPVGTVRRFFTYLQLVCVVFIIWDLYTTPTALRAGLQAYVFGAFIAALNTYYNYSQSNEFYFQRYTAGDLQVNHLGIALALGIPIAWYLTLFKDKGWMGYWLRLVDYAYVPAAGLAISLVASRASFLMSLGGFIFIFMSLVSSRTHVRILLFGALLASFFALAPLVPEDSIGRSAGWLASPLMSARNTGRPEGRLQTWRAGLAISSQRPVLGVGSGGFKEANDETGHEPHNLVIALLAELGPIGLILFVSVLMLSVYHAMLQPKPTRGLWLTVLFGLAIALATHNAEGQKQTWLLLGLVTVGAGLCIRSDESRHERSG